MYPAIDVIQSFTGNAFRWDLSKFIVETGLTDSPETRELFIAFQQAATLLRRFDNGVMAALTRPSISPNAPWVTRGDAYQIGTLVRTGELARRYPAIGAYDDLAANRKSNALGTIVEVRRRLVDGLTVLLVEHANDRAPYFDSELGRSEPVSAVS